MLYAISTTLAYSLREKIPDNADANQIKPNLSIKNPSAHMV
jgi:hypothetical protein